MKEMLDIYDSKMNKIGIEERGVVHSKGYWHKTFHCWIIREEEGKKYLVVQKRDKNKKAAPNYLDITAAGHLSSGETPLDGVREIEEELGIKVDPNQLIDLGIRISASDSKTRINKEFCHVYLLHDNTPINNYKLQENEVSGIVEIPIDEGFKLFLNEIASTNCNAIFLEDGVQNQRSVSVSVGDFIPRIEAYYLKILIMAERYFEGKKGLAI